MKADYIEVKGINFLNILQCSVSKKINEHGYAKIIGIIEDDYEETCLELAIKQNYIEIRAKELDGKSECFFTGYIDNLEIDCSTVKTVTVELLTGSKFMDLVERTRTFQNVGMTYKQIVQSNEKWNQDVSAASIFLESGGTSIGDLIVQYKETDWEFAKRMAALNNTFIRPEFTREGCKYFWGLNKEQNVKTKPDSFFRYKIKKRNTEYEKNKKTNLVKIQSADSYSYYFSSRNIFEIGDCIHLNSQNLFVYKVNSEYEGQELVNTYEMRTADGFKRARYFNRKIIGASLSGTVLKAERDQIKMKLDVDKNYSDHGEKFFLYSTVYSSPDGTGWYCMPEAGDCIRLYFPTEKERDAYAISSVHLEVAGSGSTSRDDGYPSSRQEPDYKSFSNPAGKEIIFAPDSLYINNPAVGSILLDDKQGIIIDSDKSIQFKAVNFVEIHSTTKEMVLNAKEDITLEQGENVKFSLNDNVYLKGAKLKLQE